jgi:hypothetical protein
MAAGQALTATLHLLAKTCAQQSWSRILALQLTNNPT